MRYTNLFNEYERPTLKSQRQDETVGQAVLEIIVALIVVGALFAIGNIVLGLN